MRTNFWLIPDEIDHDQVHVYDVDPEKEQSPYNFAVMHIDFFYPNGYKADTEIYDLLNEGKAIQVDVAIYNPEELDDAKIHRNKNKD